MIEGKCHCGQVSWSYPLKPDGATACNCSLCSRYGAMWIYGYLQDGIKVSGETNYYERGSKINGFHFCKTCGCIAYYLANKLDSEGRRRIAVNLRMATDPDAISNMPIDHFDGRDKFEDLPRDGKTIKDLWF